MSTVANGTPRLGTWMMLPAPANAEMAVHLGFDWLAVDMEHTELSLADLAGVARALKGGGTELFARVKSCDALAIRKALDAGAAGVIVPLVNSAEQAAAAVAAAMYPPQGVRGYAFCRANLWGLRFDEYAREANACAQVFVMIETREAVERIEEILRVPGLTGVFLGPYDLSGSYGVTGQTGHPLVLAACQRVADACRAAGKVAGQHLVTFDKARVAQEIARGYTFIALGIDVSFIAQGMKDALRMAGRDIL